MYIQLTIFYILLLINSYFSIKFFAKIIPDIWPQRILNTVLALFYVVLAYYLDDPIFFVLTLALFFALATLKYVQLLRIVKHQPHLFKSKITADCLGVVLSIVTLGGIIRGYLEQSLWMLVIVFVIANVWTLLLFPLYRKDH
jgi:hypothetical protein